MNLGPLRNAAVEMTSLFHQLLQSMTDTTPIWPGQAADDGSLLMSALAGVAAAVSVALILVINSQTGYRRYRDMLRLGLVAALGFCLLALLAFVIYDTRNATLAHIAKAPLRGAAEFHLLWQTTTERAKALATEMERMNRPVLEAHQG